MSSPVSARFFLFLSLVVSALLAHVGKASAEKLSEHPEAPLFIERMQNLHGFDAQELQKRLARLTPDARVLKLVAPPASPTQRSWQRYRSRFLEERRIEDGLAFWRENAATLTRASLLYGVPEEIVVAIIGIETLYGRNTGDFNTFSALATLAFHEPRRAEFFRQELEQLLLLAREQKRDPESYTGSYAGALGLPQFMPGSLRRYAVDFDQDGRIDLAGSAADAIGSVAHFLAQHGWREKAPIALPVVVAQVAPRRLQDWVDAGIRPTLGLAALRNAGLRPRRGIASEMPDAPATFIDLVTPDASTEYWLGYENFYVISRYNRSSFYAMAVYQSAEALAQRYRLPEERP
ncbi:MAG: lytic murein transglycosylase B [Zoogloeaceae bacterium]|jgi:membrane-bound lytic murein transglycosylase B|nr:lytic murein transglycosylase B [Zoogloeaceae bacterium]